MKEDHVKNKIVLLFIYQMRKNPANFTLKQVIVEKEQIVIIIIRQKNKRKSKNTLNNIKKFNKLNLNKNRVVNRKSSENIKKS